MVVKRESWSIVEKLHNGRTKINFYPFCLAENILIEHFNGDRLLNKRKNIIGGCRHQVKLLLKSFKWK